MTLRDRCGSIVAPVAMGDGQRDAQEDAVAESGR
jgi:hypothetical protein